jgi:hypothetical protein
LASQTVAKEDDIKPNSATRPLICLISCCFGWRIPVPGAQWGAYTMYRQILYFASSDLTLSLIFSKIGDLEEAEEADEADEAEDEEEDIFVYTQESERR